MNLSSLRSKMKCDPEGYESELILVYNQFKSSLNLFQQQASLSFTSISGIVADPSVAKDLGERVMFLAHVTPFYAKHLANEFPKQLAEFLQSSARSLPPKLRFHVAQAIILLINRKIVDIGGTLAIFMELQTLGDRNLKKLASSHVVQSIRRMNQKHTNQSKNRSLQNVLFAMLQQEDETLAKRSLGTVSELYRRKVWCDERTANAICRACFHSSSRIMIAALSFLLDYEKIEDGEDSDNSSSEDDSTLQNPQTLLSKEARYKAHHKGTLSSKKKKKAKLQRAIRSMKRQQSMSSEKSNSNYYSPLYHLKDAYIAQEFAEKLFSRLRTCNERFEVKMMMIKVIARTIGFYGLSFLNFFPYLQKYIQPHQRDVTHLLAAAVQACHHTVDETEAKELLRKIVDEFVHDRSRTEAIAVGLNVVREICLRVTWVMDADLLQDLVSYKKSHEKAVSIAARSLVTLFREICPSLLVKKDRGRWYDSEARPKALGEVKVFNSVPGVELLHYDVDNADSDNSEQDGDDTDEKSTFISSDGEVCTSDDEQNQLSNYNGLDGASVSDVRAKFHNLKPERGRGANESEARKRKFHDFGGQLNAADTSLRALKRLTVVNNTGNASLDDGILSNEDFQRIKELKAKKEAKIALSHHGLLRKGITDSDQVSVKRVDPANLEVHVRAKLSKEERLALVRAGREDRGKYLARAAVKQKKTGGLSNRQKEHKKFLPLAAKRATVAKSRQVKRKQQNRSGKQFRGRKAWK
ncbi:protein SDA1 isoform X3 [Tripterygium wilfordii]|uniref:Protein SDA1 n=1 Tax=Tripterygium wilfordii TaxID=458696 RepID=A0A7J7DSA9_TRIWF|nr:protein SDA1 homolog [Tripterygium wilfordii]KAF5749191.1 protein SDA1 isoform X3 [Tripterygium wilfordii]